MNVRVNKFLFKQSEQEENFQNTGTNRWLYRFKRSVIDLHVEITGALVFSSIAFKLFTGFILRRLSGACGAVWNDRISFRPGRG